MTTPSAPAAAPPEPPRWREPSHVGPRGTLIVLAGRGETAAVYQRFGTRLSADAYRVAAVETDTADGPPPEALVAALLDDPDTVAPVVLVGSDTGALLARRLADRHADKVAGLVLAGLPGEAAVDLNGEAEIAARTACGNHRLVLAATARTGRFARPLGLGAAGAALQAGFPVLAFHGAADQLSPLAEALPRYAALGAPEVVVLREGRHDSLNDSCHRTVAATLVLWLERLRLGRDLPEVATRSPVPTPR